MRPELTVSSVRLAAKPAAAWAIFCRGAASRQAKCNAYKWNWIWKRGNQDLSIRKVINWRLLISIKWEMRWMKAILISNSCSSYADCWLTCLWHFWVERPLPMRSERSGLLSILIGPLVAHWWPISGPLVAHWWPISGLLVAHWWPLGGPLVAPWWPLGGPLVAHWWPIGGPLAARLEGIPATSHRRSAAGSQIT